MAVQTKSVFRFADLEVHEQELRATRGGHQLDIEPKAFRVLVHLIKHAGHLVSKSDLMDAVWGDTAVTENSLTRAIALLRRVLEDDPHQPHFIETVATAGYRFICPVDAEEFPTDAGRASSQVAEAVPITGATEEMTSAPASNAAKLLRWRWILFAASSALLISTATLIWYASRPLPPPHITRTMRLTNDPRYDKFPFGSDANRIYMTLHPAAFGQVPVSGGEITTFSVNIPNFEVVAGYATGPISPDGSSFLAYGHQDPKDQLIDIWVVGISGSPVRFLTRGWHVAWSADGKQVIYSTPNREIYTIPSDGGQPHLLRVMDGPGYPYNFAYSPNGARIRFHWGRPCRLMEMSPDGSNLHEVLAGWHPDDYKRGGVWTPDGDFFLFLSASSSERQGFAAAFQLWALDERHAWLRKPAPGPIQLTFGPMTMELPVVSRDGREVFVKVNTVRGELVRYNRQSRQLEPFLGGISADMLDFSRDGKYVAYASFPGDILWRANSDGTGVQEVAKAMAHPTAPRWSPDGNQIAFMDYFPNGTSTRTYVVSSQGGAPVRVLPDSNCCDEVDPTWSPDGKKLAIWVESPDGKTETELRIVNLSTHEVSYLPRPPKRAWSPRWSPDGRYIACVINKWPADEGLQIYDFKTNKWRIILTEPGSGWLSWSKDSRSIYYMREERPQKYHVAFFRFSVEGGRPERIADIPGLRPAGWLYSWYGFDPDENPIMLRDAGANEIYALTLERK